MKPVSLVHCGDIGLSANLDQAMSKKKKKKKKKKEKEKTTKIHAQKKKKKKKTHTQFFRPNWPKFCIWEEEFLINIC